MRAHVMTVGNPFDPIGSRQHLQLRRRARVRALAPCGHAPVIALLNGRPILRAAWRYRLRDGDRLVFCVLPRGGGGGGGSNPLRILLSLALLVFAGPLAGSLLGSAGIEAAGVIFGGVTYGHVATLAITLAGSAAINALLPVKGPASLPTPSPTYTLNAQGNTARIDQALPVHYGRLLSYPDFAALPYAEYAGNEQYLYQLLCLGVGEYDVEDIRIEDTPLSSFTEVETQIVGPGEQVTLFPTSVVTSLEVSGQELAPLQTGTWSRSGTIVSVTEAGHGRVSGQALDLEFTTGAGPDGKYALVSVTDDDTYTVAVASGSGSGAVNIRAITGGLDGFVTSAAGTVAHRLSLDLVLPIGLHAVTANGAISDNTIEVIFEAQQIDDDGLPLGSWYELGHETLSDRTNTPVRKSYFYKLATAGRYRVRAWKVDAHHPSTGAADQVLLASVRAYLREDEDFGPVTMIAMRMRATNNLSRQASRKISVLATRKLPVWNGVSWSAPQVTRSISWALADAASDGDYGAGLPDAKIDLAALLALDATWSARGDHFDARFDQAGTWWDAASRIAMVGRARIFQQGGILRCVRDGADSLPVALFSMHNIARGSFSVDYLMPSEDTGDAITVKYFDATTWATRRVTATLAGSAGEKPVELDLSLGVTDRDQALREGYYHAAANKYRRRIARFSTEMEGFIPSIGDLIAINHDMPAWGAHAQATKWKSGSKTLTLSEEMIFGAGAHYVGLRRRDGSVSGPWAVNAGASPNEVILSTSPDITPDTGHERERTHVVFGPGEAWAALAKVASVRPTGLYEVEIEAVLEDPSVHTAEDGQTAPPIRVSQLPGVVTKPVVTGLLARRLPDEALRTMMAWQPAPDAEIYQIEMAEGDDPNDANVSWTRAVDTTAAHHVITLLYAARTMVRVRGLGLAAGPWVSAVLGDLIPEIWNTDATPMWTSDSNSMWSS